MYGRSCGCYLNSWSDKDAASFKSGRSLVNPSFPFKKYVVIVPFPCKRRITRLKAKRWLSHETLPTTLSDVYHPIKNTANQNTRMYYTRPFHYAPRVCRIDCVVHCIFDGMVWHSYATLSSWRSLKYRTCHLQFLGIRTKGFFIIYTLEVITSSTLQGVWL